MALAEPSPDIQDSVDSLWRFAVTLYGRGGVSEACLTLQDRHGVDVPVALFVVWIGVEHGCGVGEAELSLIQAEIGTWHAGIVQPLRAARRRLKSDPLRAPSGASEKLRQQIKSAELDAERMELAALADLAEQRGWTGGAGGDGALAAANLAALLGHLGADPSVPAIRALLATLTTPD
ncbi:hypothetical protein LCGC14_0307840 [marine sediment metagenome]|uniref:TIGR02444 family protein n=1 Tax=marine sediment metagenome TaxID=412755 RepID=A0A0F9U5M1_9ZZZZ